MNTFETCSLIIQILAFIAVIYQLRLVLRALRADHERIRKQSTIEQLGHEYRECRYALESKFGTNHLSEEEIKIITTNNEYEANIKRLLGVLEHIAVGVNAEIYDKEIVFSMSSSSMIDIYKRMEPFIEYRRKKGHQSAYTDFQHLIRDFENKKITPPSNRGNIKFSNDS